MEIEHIVALLIEERNRLDGAIHALQGPKRRGRPANKASSAVAPAAPVKRKRTLSAACRKAIADAAKRRWAAIKAGKTASLSAKKKRSVN